MFTHCGRFRLGATQSGFVTGGTEQDDGHGQFFALSAGTLPSPFQGEMMKVHAPSPTGSAALHPWP
ncbi:MAG: hypothetical protein ACE5EQ_09365, partial [Phycisphaerae bacterium]